MKTSKYPVQQSTSLCLALPSGEKRTDFRLWFRIRHGDFFRKDPGGRLATRTGDRIP
jgi:hypothetical protein